MTTFSLVTSAYNLKIEYILRYVSYNVRQLEQNVI